MDLIYKDLTCEIIDAAFEVHKTLGCGFLEAVYQCEEIRNTFKSFLKL